MEALSIYIGDRLGVYGALRAAPSPTSTELAAQVGCNERYVREWLEQQAVTGLLDVEGAAGDALSRRYSLSPAGAEVLADPDSLNYMPAVVRLAVSLTRP